MRVRHYARQLVRPLAERHFVYAEYDRLLRTLAGDARFLTVPLRDFSRARPSGSIVVGLRHDIDEDLQGALSMARLERRRGLRSTYYVLHTAPYYGGFVDGRWVRRGQTLLPALRELQDLGHEVGWHNDLVTVQCIHGVDPVDHLARELSWLREHGIDVVGTASHGASGCRTHGYHNDYAFAELQTPIHSGFPRNRSVNVGGVEHTLGRCGLAESGLDYDAYRLDNTHYFSDTPVTFTGGRRWHPSAFDAASFAPGDRIIILTHPVHWDRRVWHKYRRLLQGYIDRRVRGSRVPAA